MRKKYERVSERVKEAERERERELEKANRLDAWARNDADVSPGVRANDDEIRHLLNYVR
jgi:hypothetical protein